MILSDLNFPRQLEADGAADKIRRILLMRQTLLYAEGAWEAPLLRVDERFEGALKKARMQRRVRLGLEDILEKLAAEKKGLDDLRQKTALIQQERISRLLLFSNDGSLRLYRHIEQTLTIHFPRILGVMLDLDGKALGRIITGRSSGIKVILIEHKDAVADILRALL